MTEPTVTVAVLLIERAKEALLEVPPSSRNADIYGEFSALLSQQTPSAEHHDLCATRIPGMGIPGLEGVPQPCNCHLFLPEPPSIADMTPGTTFRADTTYGTHGELFFAAGDGWFYGIMGVRTDPDDIDPSTIRDVTPPTDKETNA